MTDYQKILLQLIVLTLLYIGALFVVYTDGFVKYASENITIISVPNIRFILNALPWYALMNLGCYCLYRMGMDLLIFRDCPEEIDKLKQVNTSSCTHHVE